MYSDTGRSAPVVLIPAYRPDESIVGLVTNLRMHFSRIVAVDDGSGSGFALRFAKLGRISGVVVLRHPENRGKGAALKTGIDYILAAFPECCGVVTADADGQHLVADIRRVGEVLAQNAEDLALGSRTFDRLTPWRSRWGNIVTRGAVRLILSMHLRDTQTGLRGIPLSFARRLLDLKSNGYAFELDMLAAARSAGIAFREVTVRTVYYDDNRGSHFNPFLDSLQIYFLLLRLARARMTAAFLLPPGAFRPPAVLSVGALRLDSVIVLSGAASYSAVHALSAVSGWPLLGATALSLTGFF